VHGGKVDLESVTAGLDRQRDGKMRFSHPRRSQKDDVLMLGDKREIEELHDGLLVQMRMEREVVFLNGFGKGKAGDLQGGFDPSLFLGGHFLFQEVIQEREIRNPVFLGMRYDGVQDLCRPGQLETFEIVLEAFMG